MDYDNPIVVLGMVCIPALFLTFFLSSFMDYDPTPLPQLTKEEIVEVDRLKEQTNLTRNEKSKLKIYL